MTGHTRRGRQWPAAAFAALAVAAFGMQGAAADTAVKVYAQPIGGAFDVIPLLSAGDKVPRTGAPTEDYQMVGIPDGLGVEETPDGAVLYMNHELGQTVQSQPIVGGPTYRGSLVSRYVLDEDGDPVSGDLAFDEVYQDGQLVGPIATTANSTAAFARFCSASLAGAPEGFDRPIFMTNEESDAASGTFSPLGGQSVAIFDGEAHALSRLGHFPKENDVVQPTSGRWTAIFSLEDGPTTPDSQLYLYVGKKQAGATSVLRRNGLDNGELYTFAASNPSMHTEADFSGGSIWGRWVRIHNARTLSESQLETAADAVGAFGFVRIEDGAFSKSNANDFYFDTTGGNGPAGNALGRLYHVRLNPGNPLGGRARLDLIYDADVIVAKGGDVALSPDNLDTSAGYLMVQEDGTTQSRLVMAAKGRDGSIWRFPLDPGEPGTVDVQGRTRVVTLSPPGRDNLAVGPGVWETSGIIDTSDLFGDGSWIFDVQAHSPTTAPAPGTVEDGQLLIMLAAPE